MSNLMINQLATTISAFATTDLIPAQRPSTATSNANITYQASATMMTVALQGALNLGSLATQNANAVAITGGTLSGLTSITTATMTATGGMTVSGGGLAVTGVISFSGDTGISRDSAGIFDFGNGAAGDRSGILQCAALRASNVVNDQGGFAVATTFGGSIFTQSLGIIANGDGVLPNNAVWAWSSGLTHSNATNKDTGLSRVTGATVAVGNGTAGDTSGILQTGVLQQMTYTTFAGLPAAAAGNKGQRRFITDGAAAPTFSATAAGGGTLFSPVYSDGTTWRNG